MLHSARHGGQSPRRTASKCTHSLAPLHATAPTSQSCDTAKHAPHLSIHEVHLASESNRCAQRAKRDIPPRPITHQPEGGTTLLKFIYGQLYNGKIVKRYGHAPTDECPLCRRPDSCTHIGGECKYHKQLVISRHNATCQLVHAAIRNSAKGGGALYSAEDPPKPVLLNTAAT